MDNERWAVVTGSSSGIGRATALKLSAEGWNVGLHYAHNEAGIRKVERQIVQAGRKCLVEQADLEDPEAGPKLVERFFSRIDSISAWIQIAGVDLLTGPRAKLPFEQKLVLATNVDLWGTMLTSRAAGEKLSALGRGVIITVGWDQSATGMAGDSGELFAAIKGGIAAFSRSLAKSLAPKVRVNCVAPGWIKTAWGEQASEVWQQRVLDETPLKRWGTPEDIADTIAFLVSDEARFLTGQTINVNGGVVAT